MLLSLCFFFSRKRRHTSFDCDWISDVCSSDLFTAHDGINEELHALFNELTGSSRPPQAAFRRLLVAPTDMLDRFLALIAREAAHARAGRGGRLRAELHRLPALPVDRAAFRASPAG